MGRNSQQAGRGRGRPWKEGGGEKEEREDIDIEYVHSKLGYVMTNITVSVGICLITENMAFQILHSLCPWRPQPCHYFKPYKVICFTIIKSKQTDNYVHYNL